MRARLRRRRVFYFLLEAMGLTFLIGLFPPLRPFWYAAAALCGMLVLYVTLLLTLSRNHHELQRMQRRFVQAVESSGGAPTRAAMKDGARHGLPERHVSIGRGRATRPAYNGLSVIETEEVHVVVRSAGALQPAVR
jgi:hypothetical protein